MQGWLFLTFVLVGSLVGITGMRLFFRPAAHHRAECDMVRSANYAPAAHPAQCHARQS